MIEFLPLDYAPAFIGGLVSSIFGGGGSSSSSSVQNTTKVDVTVNPEIGVEIDLDLSPIAQTFEQINQTNAERDALLAGAIDGQSQGLADLAARIDAGISSAFDKLGAVGGDAAKIAAILGVGFILWKKAK